VKRRRVRGPLSPRTQNPSSGNGLRIADAKHRRPYLRTAANGRLWPPSPTRGEGKKEGNSVLVYVARRIVYVIPIVISVAAGVLFCWCTSRPAIPWSQILPAGRLTGAGRAIAHRLRLRSPAADPVRSLGYGKRSTAISVIPSRPDARCCRKSCARSATPSPWAIAAAMIGFSLGLLFRADRRLLPRYLDRPRLLPSIAIAGVSVSALLARHGCW